MAVTVTVCDSEFHLLDRLLLKETEYKLYLNEFARILPKSILDLEDLG